MNHEDLCKSVITENPDMLIPWYLITSILYYERDISIISDELYDLICSILDDEWDNLEHRHKRLIDRESLNAGTGYYLKSDELPSIILGAANRLADQEVF